MKNKFTEHPTSVNETYWQHMKFASLFGFNMVFGGVACLIHAIFPFWFQQTGSNVMLKQMQEFVERMPVLEERVVVIGELIEKKRRESK